MAALYDEGCALPGPNCYRRAKKALADGETENWGEKETKD
jgi:hypothetical protein